MKIPAPILQMIFKMALSHAGSVIALPLEKVPHIQVIAKAYEQGEPLEVIVGLYLQSTESLKDDEVAGRVGEVLEILNVELPKILAKFSSEPFSKVLEELLQHIHVPDLNGDKTNEIKVIEIINKAMSELAN